MVEGGGLENRCGGNSTLGSNPSPSAMILNEVLRRALGLDFLQICLRIWSYLCGVDPTGFSELWKFWQRQHRGAIVQLRCYIGIPPEMARGDHGSLRGWLGCASTEVSQ